MVSSPCLSNLETETNLICAGIPVKHYPDNDPKMKPVQYAALMADLVKHTTYTLKSLNIIDQHSLSGFQYLRMRTAQDTEIIVTEFVTPTTQNAYILVAIQDCSFKTAEEGVEGDGEEAKE